MSRAVRFDRYGGVDVLQVVEVPRPVPTAGQALVSVKAAGINPGEAAIREGRMHERWPATFPSGQGSDLAGVVEEIGDRVAVLAGDGAELRVGDEVIGWTDRRASQAELVLVEHDHLIHRPAGVPWEVAGGLFVVGTTAYAAVRAVALSPGEVVAVSGAAGGVGSLVVQLAKRARATVIGLAGEANHEWLSAHGVIPVSYGEGVRERLREVAGGHIDAFLDTFGGGYVELALDLGVPPERVETIADFQAAQRHGVKAQGSATAASATVLAELARMIASGELELPVAHVYPLEQVQEAYRELERRHTHGKIVLVP